MLKERKKIIEKKLAKVKDFKYDVKEILRDFAKNQQLLQIMNEEVSIFCKNEDEINSEIQQLFNEKKFEEFDCSDISKLLWKMDLAKYQQIFEDHQINGELIFAMLDDCHIWKQMGLDRRDGFYVSFYFKLMQEPGYVRTFSPDFEEDCCVCSHNTPEQTIHLFREYEIPIDKDLILKNNYCTPIIVSSPKVLQDLNVDILSPEGKRIVLALAKFKKIHKNHLKKLRLRDK